jgi:hypothetical protein
LIAYKVGTLIYPLTSILDMGLEQKIKNTCKNVLIGSSLLFPLYSCQGAQTSDYVHAVASMAGAGGLAKTAEQAAGLSGVMSLSNSISENNRAKMGAPNVNVYGGGNSGNNQPIIVEKEMAVDANNLRFDSRVSDVSRAGNKLLFCLDFNGQKDIYSAIENENYEWEKVRKLTYTPELNEVKPSFLADGKHFYYEVEKKGVNTLYWNICVSDFDGNSKTYTRPEIIKSNLEEKFGILSEHDPHTSELWRLNESGALLKKICDFDPSFEDTRGMTLGGAWSSISHLLFKDSPVNEDELMLFYAFGEFADARFKNRPFGRNEYETDLEFRLIINNNVFDEDPQKTEKIIKLNSLPDFYYNRFKKLHINPTSSDSHIEFDVELSGVIQGFWGREYPHYDLSFLYNFNTDETSNIRISKN